MFGWVWEVAEWSDRCVHPGTLDDLSDDVTLDIEKVVGAGGVRFYKMVLIDVLAQLSGLTKDQLLEMARYNSPPELVVKVVSATLIVMVCDWLSFVCLCRCVVRGKSCKSVTRCSRFSVVLDQTKGRGSKNHLEEKLLDQAQAQTPYPPPPLLGGHLRSIPQGMILDVQPLVKIIILPDKTIPQWIFLF